VSVAPIPDAPLLYVKSAGIAGLRRGGLHRDRWVERRGHIIDVGSCSPHLSGGWSRTLVTVPPVRATLVAEAAPSTGATNVGDVTSATAPLPVVPLVSRPPIPG